MVFKGTTKNARKKLDVHVCVEKGRRKGAPHSDRQANTLDVVLLVIQCDYGYLAEVGDESVVALFATCQWP